MSYEWQSPAELVLHDPFRRSRAIENIIESFEDAMHIRKQVCNKLPPSFMSSKDAQVFLHSYERKLYI